MQSKNKNIEHDFNVSREMDYELFETYLPKASWNVSEENI
jgi:hypothetical protein